MKKLLMGVGAFFFGSVSLALLLMSMSWNSLGYAAAAAFSLSVFLVFSLGKSPNREVVTLVVGVVFAGGYHQLLKSGTDPELSAFFQSGTHCSNIVSYWAPDKTTQSLGREAEHTCLIMMLKGKVKQLPADEAAEKIYEAAKLFRDKGRFTPTNLVLLESVDVLVRGQEKKAAATPTEKDGISESLMGDLTRLLETYPHDLIKKNTEVDGYMADKMNSEIERKAVIKTLSHVKKSIQTLKTTSQERFPANQTAALPTPVPPLRLNAASGRITSETPMTPPAVVTKDKTLDAYEALSRRLATLQENWKVTDEELRSAEK